MSKKLLSQLEDVANAYTYIDNDAAATEINKIIVKVRDEGKDIIEVIGEARILSNSDKEKLINEINARKNITLLAKERADGRLKIFMKFTSIHGVGPKTAHEWIARGYKTINDILRAWTKTKEINLTNAQIIGTCFYKPLNTPIARADITKIVHKLGKIINEVVPSATYEVAGSYRRGKKMSGDIDIIICARKPCLAEINTAIEMKYIHNYHKLAIGESRVSFLYKYSGGFVIIDLLYSTRAALAPALLYFTGSWLFNHEIRTWAKRKGYTLNQYGVFDTVTGAAILARTEKSIFKILGLKYLEPEERICSITPL